MLGGGAGRLVWAVKAQESQGSISSQEWKVRESFWRTSTWVCCHTPRLDKKQHWVLTSVPKDPDRDLGQLCARSRTSVTLMPFPESRAYVLEGLQAPGLVLHPQSGEEPSTCSASRVEIPSLLCQRKHPRLPATPSIDAQKGLCLAASRPLTRCGLGGWQGRPEEPGAI